MKQHIFSGTATALVTPFTEGLSGIDMEGFCRITEHQVNNNINAVVVAGTTGESPVLSNTEKNRLFKAAVEICKGKIPVIAGTGSNNTEEAVKKSNEAEKKGVDGLLIVTPFYNKCTQEGAIRHYFYIADRVSTPIIVYNVPARTGFDISPETYKILAEHKNIAGIKEASSDITKIYKTRALCKDKLDIYTGNDNMTSAVISAGGKGVISVASNIMPYTFSTITSLLLSGNIAKGTALQIRYDNIFRHLFEEVNPVPVKYLASLKYGISPELRLPLTRVSPTLRKKLDKLKIPD